MKQNRTKRLIAIALAAGMLFTQMPTAAFAVTDPEANAVQAVQEEVQVDSEETPDVEEMPDAGEIGDGEEPTPDDVVVAPEHPDIVEDAETAPTYDDMFRIPNSAITSISYNAGRYGNSVITNAIGGNPKTHWETNKPNSNTFHNMVTVSFDDAYEVASFHFQARQTGAWLKGFPLEYKLYYSETESGEDFQVLKEGSFNSAIGDMTAIDFEPTTMRRFRLEFVRAKENWASLAEIAFYKNDELTKAVNGVFADDLHTALKPEYQNEDAIRSLMEQVKTHPSKEYLNVILNDALTVLKNPDAFSDKIFTALQRGNISKEKQRAQIRTASNTFLHTGYYVTPGETLYVYAHTDGDSVLPQVVFGQFANNLGGLFRYYQLQPGMNKITAPEADKMHCAAIYINNAALPEDQPYAPQIRIDGGTKFPMFVLGESTTEGFKAELEEYLETVSYNDGDFANGNPNGYHYNIAEYSSENVSITTSAEGALKELNKIVNNGSSVEEKLQTWEDFYMAYAWYSGFEMEDESSPNYRCHNKFMSRVMESGPFAYAAGGYTGYNGGNSLKKDDSFYASLLSAVSVGGWATGHEWGHMYDSPRLGIPEVTNNLYPLLMQDMNIGINRLEKNKVWPFLLKYHNADAEGKKEINNKGGWNYLSLVHQLELEFGRYDFYGKASLFARQNPDGILDGLNKYEAMDVAMSKSAGIDLTPHFVYYNLPISDEVKALLSDLPKLDKKTWYINSKYEHEREPFTGTDVKPVIQAESNGQINLTITLDQPENSILCYEIYRDGEVIGVTYDDKFTDTTAQPDTIYTYTALAYDRELSTSQMSDPVEKNSSEPQFLAEQNAVVALDSEFDPLSIVTATSAEGEDLTSAIVVTENTVDTSARGVYSVSYAVGDAKGNRSEASVEAAVMSAVTYLSDLNWVSAQTDWNTVRKDKSTTQGAISVLTENGEHTFAKGLGIHANSTIIYDLSDVNANTFQAYVGVDGVMRDANASSITFEVYVDGEKKFDSGMMKKNTPAKFVNVDVTGASELKLVVTNGGNGNGSDHADWADAKLLVDNQKPVISGAESRVYTVDEAVEDLLAGVTAEDYEDGDLTDALQVESDVQEGVPGAYEVAYTVEDSEGAVTTKTIQIGIGNAYVSAVDVDWEKATVGYGTIQKNKSISGNPLRLLNEGGGETVYESGIGTHARSEITYDLTGKNFFAFESDIGVDGAQRRSTAASITFEVYVDGVLKYDSGMMKANTPKKHVSVNTSGASSLKLVITNGGNGIGSDHGDWADAKFFTYVNKQSLAELTARGAELGETLYTEESWAVFAPALEAAQEVLNDETARQGTIDAAAEALETAMEALVRKVDRTALHDVLAFAEQVAGKNYVDPSLNHNEARWNNFVEALQAARALEADASQEDVDVAKAMLIYTLEEIGQTYVPDGEPENFVDRTELNDALAFAEQITDRSYIDPSLKHADERWSNFIHGLEDAQTLEADALQKEVDRVAGMLVYYLEELGQEYVPGAEPVLFTEE